jgi:hypothetical protein
LPAIRDNALNVELVVGKGNKGNACFGRTFLRHDRRDEQRAQSDDEQRAAFECTAHNNPPD